MANLGELIVGLSADVNGLRADLKTAQGEVRGFGSSTSGMMSQWSAGVARYGAIAGTAIIGAGVAMVKTAAKFEASLGNMSTVISGDSTRAIADMKRGIMDLSKTLPKTPNELGASAYDILSAGITKTSDALAVLKSSTELSIAGLGTSAQSVDIMTSAINAFGYKAEDAGEIAGILFETISLGKTTVGDMASQFGATASAAVAAGVSLADMQAALAALTVVGVPTSQAQTMLKAAFMETTKSGTEFAKAMKKAGMDMEEFRASIAEKGFGQTLEDMQKKLGMTDVEFKNLFSSVEAGTAVFDLLGSAQGAYANAQEKMGEGAANLTEAVAKQSDTLVSKIDAMKAAWERLSVETADEGLMAGAKAGVEGVTAVMEGDAPAALENFQTALTATGTAVMNFAGDLVGIQQAGDTMAMMYDAAADHLKSAFSMGDAAAQIQAEADAMGKSVIDAANQAATESDQIMSGLNTGVAATLAAGWAAATSTTQTGVTNVVAAVQAGADQIVGHSIVPDMMSQIGNEFSQMSTLIVPPTQEASMAVVQAMQAMSQESSGAATEFVSLMSTMGEAFAGFMGSMSGEGVSFSSMVAEFETLSTSVTTLAETSTGTLVPAWQTMNQTLTADTTSMVTNVSSQYQALQSNSQSTATRVVSDFQQMGSAGKSFENAITAAINRANAALDDLAAKAAAVHAKVSGGSEIPDMADEVGSALARMDSYFIGSAETMGDLGKMAKDVADDVGKSAKTMASNVVMLDEERKKKKEKRKKKKYDATDYTNDAIEAANEASAAAASINRMYLSALDITSPAVGAVAGEDLRYKKETDAFGEYYKELTAENQLIVDQMGIREELERAHQERMKEIQSEFGLSYRERWQSLWTGMLEDQLAWVDMSVTLLDDFTQGWTDVVADAIADQVLALKNGKVNMENAMRSLVGGLAKTAGEFFIKEGLAKIAAAIYPPNPMQQAGGAAEVAAGIALKALGSGIGGGGGSSYKKGKGSEAAAPPYGSNEIGDRAGGNGDDDSPFHRGQAKVVLDVGRLRGKKAIIDDLAEFTDTLMEEFSRRKQMGVEIEVVG